MINIKKDLKIKIVDVTNITLVSLMLTSVETHLSILIFILFTMCIISSINPFQVNVFFLYPLKT